MHDVRARFFQGRSSVSEGPVLCSCGETGDRPCRRGCCCPGVKGGVKALKWSGCQLRTLSWNRMMLRTNTRQLEWMEEARASWRLGAIILALCGVMWRGTEVQAQIPCAYSVSHVIQGPWCGPFWGYAITYGAAISPNGRYVVGYCEFCGSGNYRAFVFDTQTSGFTTLPWPGQDWYSMTAADCNDAGTIVGDGWDSTVYGGQRGWIYNLNAPNQYTILEPLSDGAYCAATGVNASGVVCGWRSIGPGVNPYQGFTWSPGGGFNDLGIMIDPGSTPLDIHDNCTVVGYAGLIASKSQRGFVYQNGSIDLLPPVPGGLWSFVRRINTDGTMLIGGTVDTDPHVAVSYLVRDENWTLLPPLPGLLTSGAWGLSDRGHGRRPIVYSRAEFKLASDDLA